MNPRNPSYLTQSRHGIYYFQIRIPEVIRQNSKVSQRFFRRSLKTRSRKDALRLARRWCVLLEEKYDKLVKIRRAIESFRTDIGRYGEKPKIAWLRSYLNGLGTDADLLKEFVSHLRTDELAALRERYPDLIARTERIIADAAPHNTLPDLSSGSTSPQPVLATDDLHQVIHHAVQSAVNGQKPEKQYTEEQNPLLADAIKTFLSQKTTGTAKSSQGWYRSKCQNFLDVLTVLNGGEELRISDLSDTLIRNYTDLMHKFPKEVSKQPQLQNKPFSEIVSIAKDAENRDELIKQDIDLMSLVTVGHYFTAVRELLRWLETRHMNTIDSMPANLHSIAKVTGKAKPMKRVPFDSDDLKKIFESENYKRAKFKRASDYWIPLLALYTGARQGELCQLYVSDIYEKHGIPVIDINANADKTLKNEDGSPRLVPIHNQLIELGFLDFVEKARKNKTPYLFPEEERDANGNFGAYSKRFNRYRSKLGIKANKNQKKDFHSFRHLVAGFLIGNGCEEYVANKIVGHQPKNQSETTKTYSDGAFLEVLNKWVQTLEYDIDFNYQKFWR